MMKTILFLVLWVAFAILTARPTAAENSQQAKMKACNAQASQKGLSGDARKTFMSDCLSAAPPQHLTAQQQKMKTCNDQAGRQHLTGQSRKDFMSKCLSGS